MRSVSVVFLIFAIVATPAAAENVIRFKSDAIEGVIQNRVDASKRVATANEYEKQMDPSTGAISVIGMYKVCAAAGFDIAETNGYASCRNFISEIAEKSGFGTGSATQQNCVSLFNGVWTLSPDGKMYQCVGRDGHKLVYQKSCDGAGGECVKQFAKLQTQGPVGREFIMAWADMHQLPLTCYGEYKTRRTITSPLGQDYIMCSAGGKSYEFEFDDLNQDPGTKSVKSENTTMCELYGGTIIDTGDASIEKVWQSCDMPRDVCNDKLDNLARRIGHTTQYQGYCRLSRDVKSTSIADLKQIDGVDSRIFYNAGQMRADMAKVQLEQYLRTQFPNESHINCDTNIREFNFGLGLDIDYILRCTVGSRQVDFIFDDLTEAFGYASDAGAAAMACIINGGRFAGKHCRGLTQSECTTAGLRIPGGTRWDASAGACLLNDAKHAAQINNGITIASGVVITVLTFGAGGYVTLVAVAAEVGASVAIDLAFIGLERLEETKPHHLALSFMRDAAGCADKGCAYSVVANHFTKIDEIASDLNDEELGIIAARMDEITDLLSDEEFERALSQTKKTVNASAGGLGLLTISMLVNPTRGVEKLISKAPRMAQKASRIASHMDDVARIASRADDMADSMRHLSSREIALRGKVSQNFDQHLANFLYNKTNAGFDANKVTRAEVEELNQYIAGYGARLQYSESNHRYIFTKSDAHNWMQTSDEIEHLSYLENLAKNGAEVNRVVSGADDISEIAGRYGKRVRLRTGSESLGHDYYRIMVDEGEDVGGLVYHLQSKGYYVSSGVTKGNEKFIAVSKENIFGPWENISSNWLNTGASNKVDDVARAVNKSGATGNDIRYLQGYLGNGMRGLTVPNSGGATAFVSRTMSEGVSEAAVRELNADGKYVAARLNTTGTAKSESYIVIAMSRSDAEKWGLRGGSVIEDINMNRANRAQNYIGQSIGNVRGNNVTVSNIGCYGGRPIVTVDVNGRSLPFYISTGSAGKTDIPTGKWEFFAGIDPNPNHAQWFNKGSGPEIYRHYDSPEMRQIAGYLDRTIGDIRTEKDILLSMGRQSLGGQGVVAFGSESMLGGIDLYTINKGFVITPGPNGGMQSRQNIAEVKSWLSQL